MKLHTRDQSPKEGQQPAEKPVNKWEPGRAEYLQFLVDSRHVYQCLEEIVGANEVLSSFGDSGLERVVALEKVDGAATNLRLGPRPPSPSPSPSPPPRSHSLTWP